MKTAQRENEFGVGGGRFEGRNNKIYKFMKNIFSLCDTHLPLHYKKRIVSVNLNDNVRKSNILNGKRI